jgi:methionine-S-sulfoxide reductase
MNKIQLQRKEKCGAFLKNPPKPLKLAKDVLDGIILSFDRSLSHRTKDNHYVMPHKSTILFFLATVVSIAISPFLLAEDPTKATSEDSIEKAIFAGGCFWCVEAALQEVPGVISAVSGYAGGTGKKPTYDWVSNGRSNFREAVQVTFNPSIVSYEELLVHFWHDINPTQANGQFADKGKQYTTAIYYNSEAQQKAAENSKAQLEASGKFNQPIVTAIIAETTFYPAEKYHQDYYLKNPRHFGKYEVGSGRAGYVKQVWGIDLAKKRSSKKQ